MAASPARIQQRLLAATPDTRITFDGTVTVNVQAYGFEAYGAVRGEWCYGDAMARERAAGRAAVAVAKALDATVLLPV